MTAEGTGGERAPGTGARKAIHALLSLGAAAVVYLLPPTAAAIVLAAATLVALTVELARRVSPAAGMTFERLLGGMLKPGERPRLTGATTLAVGFTATAVLLPGLPTLTGILLAGLADPPAALIGRRYGGMRYAGGKSLAGSAAFWLVALGIGLAVGLPAPAALLVATLTTVVEAPTFPVDDNLYLPLAGAAAVVLAGRFLGL